MVGGPVGSAVGAAAGAAIGIAVDMTMNAGVALMQRSKLEVDVQESLDATRQEWQEKQLAELERVQDVWYEYAEALLDTE